MRLFALSVLFFVVLAFPEISWFYSAEGQKESRINVGFRMKLINDVFSLAKIDWDIDGLFIFRERGDSLRLIVLKNDRTALLYQKPRQQESRLQKPVEYLEERKKLKNYMTNIKKRNLNM